MKLNLFSAFLMFLLTACGLPSEKYKKDATASQIFSEAELSQAEQVLRQNGVSVQRWTTPRGMQSLIILQNGSHSWNRLAAELAATHFGLRLIYSPFDLNRSGASAIFDPLHNLIGLSHQMVNSGTIDESFAHELIHADQFAARANGKTNGTHIEAKLLKGDRMSEHSYNGYVRLLSFEEVLAFGRSISFLTEKSPDAGRMNEDDLRDLYFALDMASEIAEVMFDVAMRAHENDSEIRIQNVTKGGQAFNEFIMEADAIERVYSGDRGTNLKVKAGTQLTLTVSAGSYSDDKAKQVFREALRSAAHIANTLKPHYQEAKKSFGSVIEHPNRRNIDFAKLNKATSEIRTTLAQLSL